MNMMFKAFFKKLFGAKYERLARAPFLYLIFGFGSGGFSYNGRTVYFISDRNDVYCRRDVAGTFFAGKCCRDPKYVDASF